MRLGRLALTTALVVAAVAAPVGERDARAANGPGAAQIAFDEGRRLEDAGDFAAAASRFEESERLEPALGTILNLANCYERAGRLASAWRAFRRGAEEATLAGEPKRARRASDRADALRPRLSTITVHPDEEAPGEEVRIDGAAVDRAEWSAAQPVDGGRHTVVARAAGRADAVIEVQVANEGEHAQAALPPLAPQPSAPEPTAVETAETETKKPPEPTAAPASGGAAPSTASTWTPLRVGALAGAGVGLVAVGFGVGFGVQARARWSDRQADCAYNYCNDEGYALTTQARDAATRSTVAFVIGAIGLAGGVTLFVLAPRAGGDGVKVGVSGAPGGATVHLRGAF
jgi:hypothetical protein